MKKRIQYSYIAFICLCISLSACEDDPSQIDGQDQGLKDSSDKSDASSNDSSASDVKNSDDGIDLPQELKAFPSAFGAGAYVTGGRGGKVLAVTRLDDAVDAGGEPVEGTFRWALTRAYPRIIVFRVSGTIVIGDRDGDGVNDGDQNIEGILGLGVAAQGNVTVAGQTAPLGGITIKGFIYSGKESNTEDAANNMIWRYVRVRKNAQLQDFDAVTLNDTKDIILDHLSIAYGTDESASLSTSERASSPQTGITMQNILFGYSKTGNIIGSGAREQGGEATIYNNFYANITHRFPNLAADGSYEVVNNLVSNWAFRLVNVHNAPKVNHIANAYVEGGRTLAGNTSGAYGRISNKIHNGTEGILDARIYTAKNFISGMLTDPAADNWPTWSTFVDGGGFSADEPVPKSMQVDQPFPFLGAKIQIRTAADVMKDLPNEVGAFRTLDENGAIQIYRDEIDKTYISDYLAGTTKNYDFNVSQFVYPDIPSNTPYPDTDKDGMPDAWESANGFDPSVDDSAGDADGDGYTNIEEFLNLVDL